MTDLSGNCWDREAKMSIDELKSQVSQLEQLKLQHSQQVTKELREKIPAQKELIKATVESVLESI